MKTIKEKSAEQLIYELDILIESDFTRAKLELEEFKSRPNIFTFFELTETEYTNNKICSIFVDDEMPNNHAESNIA